MGCAYGDLESRDTLVGVARMGAAGHVDNGMICANRYNIGPTVLARKKVTS